MLNCSVDSAVFLLAKHSLLTSVYEILYFFSHDKKWYEINANIHLTIIYKCLLILWHTIFHLYFILFFWFERTKWRYQVRELPFILQIYKIMPNRFCLVKKFLASCLHDLFFTYSTPKIVEVPRTTIGAIYRLVQLIIILIIAMWTLNTKYTLYINKHNIEFFYFSYIVWYKKGYQEFHDPRGTSIIKLKGVAKVTSNNSISFVRMF